MILLLLIGLALAGIATVLIARAALGSGGGETSQVSQIKRYGFTRSKGDQDRGDPGESETDQEKENHAATSDLDVHDALDYQRPGDHHQRCEDERDTAARAREQHVHVARIDQRDHRQQEHGQGRHDPA